MNFKPIFSSCSLLLLLTGCVQEPQETPSPRAFAEAVKAGKPLPCTENVSFGFPKAYVPQAGNTFVCHEEDGVGYALELNPRSKTPLWVTEHLTKDNLTKQVAKSLNDFRLDPDISKDWQGNKEDYKGSGFDRGQMAPPEDFVNSMTMTSKTFYFDNIVPQTPENNRGVWTRLENNVRNWGVSYGEVYVVSGPIYMSGNVKIWLGTNKQKKIAAPTHLFKIIYAPKQQQMIAFVIPNDPIDPMQLPYYATTPAQVEQLIGYKIFPLLPQDKSGLTTNVNPNFWPIK